MLKIIMKKCLKYFFNKKFLFIRCLLYSFITEPVTLIWDLGYTLLKPDSLNIANVIGYNNCLRMYLKHGELTQTVMSTLLRKALLRPGEKVNPFGPCDLLGQPIPRLMCDWFEGNFTNKQILNEALRLSATYKHFEDKLEKECFIKIIEWMFTPSLLADSMKPIKGMVKLLKACAQNPTHKFYVLSNWDPESFLELYNRRSTQTVFKYFKPENMYISGLIGYMKPDPRFYQYLLKEAQLDPKECIFIDDQAENICAARQCGIRAIHYTGDIEHVEQMLKKWKVLPAHPQKRTMRSDKKIKKAYVARQQELSK